MKKRVIGAPSGPGRKTPPWVLLIASAGAIPASADFIPGHVYVADPASPSCTDGGGSDRILEVDPATGDARVFAEIPQPLCGFVSGLAFTPDGQHLRASSSFAGAILEIDGTGGINVVLDGDDGIGFPQGYNNLAYDSAGSFFVSQLGPSEILTFPAAGGPAEVFADVRTGASIAAGPNDHLYVAEFAIGDNVLRFAPDGTREIIDSIDGFPLSIDASRRGDVYLLRGSGIWWYPDGDATRKENILPGVFDTGAIALSEDEETLYIGGPLRVFALDLLDLSVTEWEIGGTGNGLGLAVYVPEPGSAAAISIFALAFAARSWRRAQ